MITDLFGNPIKPVVLEAPKETPPGKVAIKILAEDMKFICDDSTQDALIVKENALSISAIGGDKNDKPIYIQCRKELIKLFGLEEAERIIMHFEDGGGDIVAYMSINTHKKLWKGK